MKNRTKFVGIIALVAVIGFVGVSCDGGGSDWAPPSPSIPSLTIGALDIPEGFFANTDGFVAPTTLEQQEAVFNELGLMGFGFVYDVMDLIEVDLSAHAVNSPAGGTFNFATDLTTAHLQDLGLEYAEGRRPVGTFTETRNPPFFDFAVPRDVNWTETTSSSGVRFNFRDANDDLPRFAGTVAASGSSRRNLTAARETYTYNTGTAMVVAFVIPNADGTAYNLAGLARVRYGMSGRGDGPRPEPILYDGVGTWTNERNRDGYSTTFQMELFTQARGSINLIHRRMDPQPPLPLN